MKRIVQGICLCSSVAMTTSAFMAHSGGQIFAYVIGAVAFVICVAISEEVL